MLDQFGLGSDAESVYRVLLRTPRAGVAELASLLGWPTERVTATLDELAELTLVRRSAEEPDRMRLVDPEFGLTGLLHRQEQELAERQRAMATARLTVTNMLMEYGESPAAPDNDVRRFIGMDAIGQQIERLSRSCESEVAVFAPRGGQDVEAMEAAKPLDRDALLRGARVRYVYLDSIRNHPPTLAYARWLQECGGEARTVPHLPLRLIIYDRQTALVPTDPKASDKGILLLRGAGVVTALHSLFQQTWEQAQPIGATRAQPAEGLTAQEEAVLGLLLEGHTDDVVARKMGVSVRTVRRVTADLTARLGARSRFQAGALAAARGWIDARDSVPAPDAGSGTG